jgi:multisubunit Na+/H+ antiporter MnhF subunit
MNFKQIIGIALLVFMIVLSYTLFGGISHEKVPVQVVKYNTTPTNESVIQEYHQATFEEQATVDISFIALMLILIGITSLGGITNPDESVWRDEEKEPLGDERND